MADEPKPSQPSLMQVLMDNTVGSMVGPKVLDAIAGYALKKGEPEIYHAAGHPKHEREGSIESLIKLIGTKYGTMMYDDLPYFEQYMHPNSDVLPKTANPNPRSKLTYREPAYETYVPGVQKADTTGLGSFSRKPIGEVQVKMPHGVAYFDNANVHDVWDFDTKAPMVDTNDDAPRSRLDGVVKLALQHSGTPFGVSGPETRVGDGDTINDNPTLRDREYTPEEMYGTARMKRPELPTPERIHTPSANVAFYDVLDAKRAHKPTSLENVLLQQMDELRTR